ncbi:hypothetical protein D3C73_1298090 [compost metagenome]
MKEGRYRVTISDMIFKSVKLLVYDSGQDFVVDDMFTKAKRSKLRTGDTVLQNATYISKDLESSFDINSKPKINTDF